MDVVRLAPIHQAHRRFGERGLDAHHRVGFAGCSIGAVAEQPEHARHMRAISVALVLELRGQIVVAVREGETVLVGRGDHPVRVGVVWCR